MTTPTRLERTLPTILDELAAGPSPEYLDDVFARTAPMRQRPGWTFPERWLPMADITRSRAFAPAPPWRLIALAIVVISLVVGALLYVGSRQQRVPPPFGPARNGSIPYISNGDIYVGDPVTGKSRLLVGGQGNDSAPGFSFDGTRVAFFRDVAVTRGTSLPVDLYVMNADGTGVTKISPSPIYSVEASMWTPDGKWVAVAHPDGPLNQLDLYDVSGRLPPQRIDAAVGIDSMEFRPPDGREILFRALVNGRYGLYAINADGTNRRTLVDPTNTTDIDQDLNSAVYSADGSRIFYQRWFPDSIQLWVMNADGTNQHRFDTQVAPAWSGEAAASPDGKWIAYWHVFEDGRPTQRVSVVRADGTGPIIQTGPELTGTAHWVWSPDSTKILMISWDGDTAYLLDPQGGPAMTVPWHSDADIDWQRLALD